MCSPYYVNIILGILLLLFCVGVTGQRAPGLGGISNVCIECIEQFTAFVCSIRTRLACSSGSYKNGKQSAPIYTALLDIPPSPGALCPWVVVEGKVLKQFFGGGRGKQEWGGGEGRGVI